MSKFKSMMVAGSTIAAGLLAGGSVIMLATDIGPSVVSSLTSAVIDNAAPLTLFAFLSLMMYTATKTVGPAFDSLMDKMYPNDVPPVAK